MCPAPPYLCTFAIGPRAVLNEEKKSVPLPVFKKRPAGTPCAQPWLVAVGGWRLAAVGGWQLATGGWWRLVVVGSWRLVAAAGWRRLVVGGWWRLAVDGSWRLAVGGPLGRSLRAVLSKKKNWFLEDRPGWASDLGVGAHSGPLPATGRWSRSPLARGRKRRGRGNGSGVGPVQGPVVQETGGFDRIMHMVH